MEDRLITVAIHTYERAVALKTLLESEGVKASLQNVNLSQPVVASGVRVRIKESDLPLALRVIENGDIFSLETPSATGEKSHTILVPLDFSPYSIHACSLAFHISKSLGTDITLLNTFVDPSLPGSMQLSDALNYDVVNSEVRDALQKDAEQNMEQFCTSLKTRIKNGELPPVKFKSVVSEGVPEEVIVSYARQTNPVLIVMGTRGADTKERELVGSVTAEVLDTCRYPVFTVPADTHLTEIESIRNIVFFCTLDQEDIIALDQLARMIPDNNADITLANIPSKKQSGSKNSAPFNALENYCRNHYPDFSFNIRYFDYKEAESQFKEFLGNNRVDLIVVPNKKKNIFSRLFNPGLAHRLLFRADIPMMVMPV